MGKMKLYLLLPMFAVLAFGSVSFAQSTDMEAMKAELRAELKAELKQELLAELKKRPNSSRNCWLNSKLKQRLTYKKRQLA